MGSSYPIFVKSNVIYAGKRVITSDGRRERMSYETFGRKVKAVLGKVRA